MKVTVIVPIYNVEQYLRECLDSVISQTLADIEVICVNDGSIDKSQEILNEYSWKDARIKIINQINQGAYAARNTAIDIAQGDYLCFIDPDDYYPDKFVLENLYIAAINNNALICGGGFQENKSGTVIKEWSGNLSQYSFKKDGMVKYKDYQFETNHYGSSTNLNSSYLDLLHSALHPSYQDHESSYNGLCSLYPDKKQMDKDHPYHRYRLKKEHLSYFLNHYNAHKKVVD